MNATERLTKMDKLEAEAMRLHALLLNATNDIGFALTDGDTNKAIGIVRLAGQVRIQLEVTLGQMAATSIGL